MRAVRFPLLSLLMWGTVQAGAQKAPVTPGDTFPVFERYARAQHYDTVAGAGDEQRLLRIKDGNKVYGPRAKIEPESTSYNLKEPALRQGRIIARIWSESSYAKLGLEAGYNWWWVDRRGTPGDTTWHTTYNARSDTAWRSVYISSSGKKKVRPMTPEPHARYRWRQAIARFLWRDTDEGTWGTCGGKCCSSY